MEELDLMEIESTETQLPAETEETETARKKPFVLERCIIISVCVFLCSLIVFGSLNIAFGTGGVFSRNLVGEWIVESKDKSSGSTTYYKFEDIKKNKDGVFEGKFTAFVGSNRYPGTWYYLDSKGKHCAYPTDTARIYCPFHRYDGPLTVKVEGNTLSGRNATLTQNNAAVNLKSEKIPDELKTIPEDSASVVGKWKAVSGITFENSYFVFEKNNGKDNTGVITFQSDALYRTGHWCYLNDSNFPTKEATDTLWIDMFNGSFQVKYNGDTLLFYTQGQEAFSLKKSGVPEVKIEPDKKFKKNDDLVGSWTEDSGEWKIELGSDGLAKVVQKFYFPNVVYSDYILNSTSGSYVYNEKKETVVFSYTINSEVETLELKYDAKKKVLVLNKTEFKKETEQSK